MLHAGSYFPEPGIKPAPPAVEAWTLNHWTAREVPIQIKLNQLFWGESRTMWLVRS